MSAATPSFEKTRLASQLALSVFVENEDSLRNQLDALNGVVAVIELRLDNAPIGLRLNAIVEGYTNFNFILCNRAAPQADYDVEPSERLYVDWPIDSALPASLQRFRVIHSWHAHDAQTKYDLADIADTLSAVRRPHDLCKMVQWCDYVEDFELYADIDLCFAQGAAAQFSRIVSLLNDAPFMYVSLPLLQTAVGQFDLPTATQRFFNGIDAQTDLCGVVGDINVASSQSPQLWHAAMTDVQPQKTFAYVPLPVANTSAFEALIQACQFKALSVTNPHKKWAETFATIASGYGAANFLLASGDGYHAFATDGMGALQALSNHGFTPKHKLLVIGNGGASQSVVKFAQQHQVDVSVCSRRPRLSEAWGCNNFSFDEVRLGGYDAFIQATTLGSEQQPGCVLKARALPAGSLALDMVYRPAETEWLQHAAACGALPVMGAEMLIEQFQSQFDLFNARPALVLIGMRGSGKTTLGQHLANELQLPFLDIDQLLEDQHQRKIDEWIASDLASFRECEAEMLAAALQSPNCVIATGGGIVESEESRELLEQHPKVLLLQCGNELLLERQQQNPRSPLTEHSLEQEIALISEQRQQWYAQCSSQQVDSSLSIAETAEHARLFFIN
ncbi:MAG: shikimate kinase [Planctomycetota bacterium]|nr:shikimate kinase [Planctomycetota bacterium]